MHTPGVLVPAVLAVCLVSEVMNEMTSAGLWYKQGEHGARDSLLPYARVL